MCKNQTYKTHRSYYQRYVLVAFLSQFLASPQLGLVHIGHLSSSCGFTRGPWCKWSLTRLAMPSIKVGWSLGVAQRPICSAPTSSPTSLAYSMSSSCRVSICSLTNAIGTKMRFFWPRFTKARKRLEEVILNRVCPYRNHVILKSLPFFADRKTSNPFQVCKNVLSGYIKCDFSFLSLFLVINNGQGGRGISNDDTSYDHGMKGIST